MEEKTRILNENEANASSSAESKQNVEKQKDTKSKSNKVENIAVGAAGLIVGGAAVAGVTAVAGNENTLDKNPSEAHASVTKPHQAHKPAPVEEKHEEKLIDVITDPEPQHNSVFIIVTDTHPTGSMVDVEHNKEHHSEDKPIEVQQNHENLTIVPNGAFPDNDLHSHTGYDDLAQNDNFSSHDDNTHII